MEKFPLGGLPQRPGGLCYREQGTGKPFLHPLCCQSEHARSEPRGPAHLPRCLVCFLSSCSLLLSFPNHWTLPWWSWAWQPGQEPLLRAHKITRSFGGQLWGTGFASKLRARFCQPEARWDGSTLALWMLLPWSWLLPRVAFLHLSFHFHWIKWVETCGTASTLSEAGARARPSVHFHQAAPTHREAHTG